MKIGTLSSELYELNNKKKTMRLTGPDRVLAIERVLRDHTPDILLTAGYSLQDESDLLDLERRLDEMDWKGLVFVEVMNWRGAPHRKDGNARKPGSPGKDSGSPCLFAWIAGEGWRNLGRQIFADSRQAEEEPDLIAEFEAALPARVVEFQGKRAGALICGEINALRGRKEPAVRTQGIGDWLSMLDILVHPIHDRMSDRGTLTAKRRCLSSGGRIYVHASNWNTAKRQKPDSASLHGVFVNGDPLEYTPIPRQASGTSIEYREFVV